MKLKYTLLALFIFLITFVIGCSAANDNKSDERTNIDSENAIEPLTIYTTIFPLEDFSKKIGREHVKVVSIFPPGVDGHTFEPSAKTMVDIANADLFVYTGAGIEGFAEATVEALKNEDVLILKASEGIELIKLDDHSHSEPADKNMDHNNDYDPHIWLDPTLAIQMADNIFQALVKKNPAAKNVFEQNFNELKQELEKLDQEFRYTVEQAITNEILVSHAAYGYWESRYGVKQISVSGMSPTNEPSQKELTQIIRTAKEHNIKYVIFEQNVSTKLADIVKKEINATALTLYNLEAITEEQATNNEDYFSMMRRNLETLKTALN